MAADAIDLRLVSRDAARRVIHSAKVFALYLPGLEMMLRTTLYGTSAAAKPKPPAAGRDVPVSVVRLHLPTA